MTFQIGADNWPFNSPAHDRDPEILAWLVSLLRHHRREEFLGRLRERICFKCGADLNLEGECVHAHITH